MAEENKKAQVNWSDMPVHLFGRSIIPFTGPFFAVYAFFWPESFGHWWGLIIHTFRTTAGF